jgi:hypothetical protein
MLPGRFTEDIRPQLDFGHMHALSKRDTYRTEGFVPGKISELKLKVELLHILLCLVL